MMGICLQTEEILAEYSGKVLGGVAQRFYGKRNQKHWKSVATYINQGRKQYEIEQTI